MTPEETAIIEFFGDKSTKLDTISPSETLIFWHKGEVHVFQITVHLIEKQVSISGDKEIPFHAMSLFESMALYETVSIEYENVFYGDKKQLVFRSKTGEIVMMVMMWDNKELSVWRYA